MYNDHQPDTHMKQESMRNYHERRLEQLKTKRQPWEPIWQEMDRLIAPGYLRLDTATEHADRGIHRKLDIIDNTGQRAHRVFRSGMHSGMTSKARPWNKLTTHDAELREIGSVKHFLSQTTTRMRAVMDKSNVYDTLHTKYGALGLIGTAASYLSADEKNIVRNTYLIAGSYWVASDFLGRVDTLYHEIVMTAKQIVEKFSKKGDNVPDTVTQAYDTGNKDASYIVYHAMEPRTVRDATKDTPKHKKYLSNYWMREDNDKDRLLRESGSDINRVICSRWDVVGNDEYGYSLGMDVVADVKQLQKQAARKLEIIDKVSRPPMTGPTSMKGQRASLLPGAITYSDEANRSGGFRPAIDLSAYNLGPLLGDIQNTQMQVKETFYYDLFMAVTNMPGVQPRNEFEIAERKEERLLQLGPALERLESEELTPLISGVYHYMKKAGVVPEMPEELAEAGEMTIQYTSILAQAQRAVGVLATERTVAFIGNLAEAKPETLDKLDADQAVDDYADRLGAPSQIILSDERVKELRAARQQQQQQQQAIETATQAAPALKQGAEASRLLAEADDTPGDPNNLLSELNLR